MDAAIKIRRFWPGGVGYAAVPLLLAQVPGRLTFALNPHAAEDIGMGRVGVPTWVFIAVWVVIYPCLGIAAWRVRRDVADASVPLAVLTAGFLQTFLFWLSDGLRAVAAADATGVLLAVTSVWVFSRYSRAAMWWLLPWVVWMPVTLVVKIIALS